MMMQSIPRILFTVSRLLLTALCLLSLLWGLPGYAQQIDTKQTSTVEVAMPPGMQITASLPSGLITITARAHCIRSYTWKGLTHSVELAGRPVLEYYDIREHWIEQFQEGQQQFSSPEEALAWLREEARPQPRPEEGSYIHEWSPRAGEWFLIPSMRLSRQEVYALTGRKPPPKPGMSFAYRDDGLVVGWKKDAFEGGAAIAVWQILVNGKKPRRLPGSQNEKVRVRYVQTEPSALVRAVNDNDLSTVKTLLAQGADPNTRDSLGFPALATAAKYGYASIVNALLETHADPMLRDEEGSTALLEAVFAGHTDIVKVLLANGADVNETYQQREKPRFSSLNAEWELRGCTPLIAAVMDENAEAVRALLDKGAEVNARMFGDETALSYADKNRQSAVVQMLKQAGARRMENPPVQIEIPQGDKR